MKYWIIIESWNLIETFMTESLSPYSFYLKRSFGNDLTRYASKDTELFNNLVLYEKEPLADYALEIDSSLLDVSIISKIKNKGFCLYPKTIYYRKGLVRFRFKDETSLKGLIAESKIIIEIKTIEKYSTEFFVDKEKVNKKHNKKKINLNETLSFELNNYIEEDNLFNSIKGGIVSYTCGVKNRTSKANQDLLLILISLKNMIAGLNTTIMIGEENIDYSSYKMAVIKAKNVFLRSQFNKELKIFETLNHILEKIVSLSTLRTDFINHQKKTSIGDVIELEKLIKELELIKKKEIENGEKEGKRRKYFPKGSKEYLRKETLKSLIKKYKQIVGRKNLIIESSSNKNVSKITQYDSTISALFVRFSDNINYLLETIKKTTEIVSNINILPNISFKKNTINVSIDNAHKEEELLYNILLNYIISNPNGKYNNISDEKIIKIIEESGKIFCKHKEANSKYGKLISNSLREFWKYKKQLNDSFNIPEELPILQAVISFLLKHRGFEQIDRFMLNRGYQYKQYAFMLWGCLIGYAGLPKTLTNILNDKTQIKILDDYLENIYKKGIPALRIVYK